MESFCPKPGETKSAGTLNWWQAAGAGSSLLPSRQGKWSDEGGGLHRSTRIRQGARGACIHARASSLRLAAMVDQDALNRVRPLLHSVVGGTACPVRDVVLDWGETPHLAELFSHRR